MDLGLQDRVVLVTGCSRGIGRAAAELFACEGARVAVGYRHHRDKAEEVAFALRDAGTDAVPLAVDLASPESIVAATAAVLDRWQRIDVLVNNAVEWSTAAARFDRQPADECHRLIATNVLGPFGLIQAVLPTMLRAGFGRIVNVSSTAAADGMRGFGWYAVAKSSLHGLTRTLAVELSGLGILTNTVMPGPTCTEKVRALLPPDKLRRWGTRTTLGRLPNPEEVARTIVFLASPANNAITGEVVRTGGRIA
jgi:3-oxoacyl-[acyl-carrier protein] reductase